MASSGERVVGGVTSGILTLGETVTFEARHFGLKFRLTSKITELERPHRFVDEMVKGPFKSIRHEHAFVQVDGGTLMKDTFQFSAPFGLLGVAVEKVFLAKYMARALEGRNAFIKLKAEGQ
jgi:ligand-binding SRPBCC domain-containing protein